MTNDAAEQDRKLICFSDPRRCYGCTFLGARVAPAASRPGHSREFRHVRCESRTLADGFLPRMARSCQCPPRRLTEGCFLPRSEHPCLDLAISQSCLLLSVFD